MAVLSPSAPSFIIVGLSAVRASRHAAADVRHRVRRRHERAVRTEADRCRMAAGAQADRRRARPRCAAQRQRGAVSNGQAKTRTRSSRPTQRRAGARCGRRARWARDSKTAAAQSKFDQARPAIGRRPRWTQQVVFRSTTRRRLWTGRRSPSPRPAITPAASAIVLRNLDPPLSPNEITRPHRPRSCQATASWASDGRSSTLAVESPAGATTHRRPPAVVLVTRPRPCFPTTRTPSDWDEELAAPALETGQRRRRPPGDASEGQQLRPQVAGDTQQRRAAGADAVDPRHHGLHLGPVRQPEVRHRDRRRPAARHAVTIVGAWASPTTWRRLGHRQLFQLEPFRINLTVVAGILTIMGYSMIDTIVVFDRIRENRGKYGHVSRQVINDAINQTLSRTLLTAGTTTDHGRRSCNSSAGRESTALLSCCWLAYWSERTRRSPSPPRSCF